MENKNNETTQEQAIIAENQTPVEVAPKGFVDYAPTVATVFFFLVFCYIVYAVFKKGTTKKFDKYSKIPLEDHDRPKR